MIKKLLTIVGVTSLMSMNAQMVLNESFTATWTPAGAGWTSTNVSVPASTNTAGWFQGNGATFASNSGGPNDYYATNFQAGTGTADLNTWLVTPTVNITNGAIIKFATRTVTASTVYPDRLQLRWSAGTGTAVGTTTAAPGTFTNLILDINPLYSTNTSPGPVSGGTVNGYPNTWTVYTTTITGVTGTVVGRFGFRYLVQAGGPTGNNSDYIGLDDVQYTMPCSATIPSYTTCAGSSVTIIPNGAAAGSTYSWNPGGSTSGSITVTPSVTTVYSLTVTEGTLVCPVKTSTITIGTALSISASASSNTICSGSTTSLTATSAATSYTWLPVGLNTAMVAVSPTANTTYTVAGQNGACFGAATVAIVVNAAPNTSVSIAGPSNSICIGSGTINFIASGGVSYVWTSPASALTTATVSANTPTTAGVYNIIVSGVGSNGCSKTATTTLVMQTCTGLNEIAVANNINVFPNPFVNELNVSVISGNVIIIDALGKVVYNSPVKANEAINTANLPKGVYFVKVKDSINNTEKTIKVIKE